MSLKKLRWKWSGLILLGFACTATLGGAVWAQDAAPAAATEEKPAAEAAAPATEEAKPAEAAAAPAAENKAPLWMQGVSDKGEPVLDPIGANMGVGLVPAPDGKADIPEEFAKDGSKVYGGMAHNWYSINFVWTLVTGFLVMFMQAGFACVETGLCRAKNSSHTFAMNLMIYPLGCFAFWVYGFAIGWGNWWNAPVPRRLGSGAWRRFDLLNGGWGLQPDAATGIAKFGLIGTKGFFLHWVSRRQRHGPVLLHDGVHGHHGHDSRPAPWPNVGAWKNFCVYGLWVAFPYCLYANWVWGGGWLAQSGINWQLGHGAVDFAGSGVVHAMGGVIALVGGIIVGPRIGKYVNGKPQAIPGHSIPMVCVGTFILAFGWFGFNPGSTLAGTDLRISVRRGQYDAGRHHGFVELHVLVDDQGA